MADQKRDIKCETEFTVGVAATLSSCPITDGTSGPGSQSTEPGHAQELVVSTILYLSLEISAQLVFLVKTAFIHPPKSWTRKMLKHIFFLTLHFQWSQTSKIPDHN